MLTERGLDLLDKAIEWIKNHPESHNQSDWRCATGMCVGGLTAELAGGRWAAPATHPLAAYLIVEPGDDPSDIDDEAHPGGSHRRGVVFVARRARRLLGLSPEDADRLFNGSNTLSDIERIRDELRERNASTTTAG